MYSFSASDEKTKYALSELARMFVPDSEFECTVKSGGFKDKKQLYEYLSGLTGKKLDWGILTGVRPSKLYRENAEKFGTEYADKLLKDEYLISDEKLALLKNIFEVQKSVRLDVSGNAVGIYVGIPFCPSRCLYCSFTSNVITKKAASLYMQALLKEINYVKTLLSDKGWFAESVYIGGGTPSSLDDEDFEMLLKAVSQSFANDKLREFTVECGRPETITVNKLRLIKNYGADRISINPQSMKQHTLDLIGRLHSPEQIREAFKMAHSEGIDNINADLIAGLSEEVPKDFEDSLSQIIDLKPADITVHTLAVKRASKLIEQDNEYSYRMADTVREMLDISHSLLDKFGYRPYYMYRQKNMAGNFENVGYALGGYESIYNIRIMEENQTIIAMGAGAVSKQYFPAENRLERVANVSNYEIYIDRIDEMIKRKEEGIK